MEYIENVIIGQLLCPQEELFGFNVDDYIINEMPKTAYIKERFLPKILVDLGIVKSIREVRSNKPQYLITLEHPDFLEIKWENISCGLLSENKLRKEV